MKNLLYLLLAVTLFSCSSDDEEETQNYTSYTITLEAQTNTFQDAEIGYFDNEGKCILLHKIGSLEPFVTTSEFILPEYHNEIYIFYEWDMVTSRLEKPFTLSENKKNTLKINESNGRAVYADKSDPTQYPQEN